MKSHFELSPAEYEAGRQGHLQRRRVALVAGDVAQTTRPGDLVMEIGCGPGDVLAEVAREFPDRDCLGLDINPAMVEYARSAHVGSRLDYRVVDIAAEPPERRARFVFGIDVLHHIPALGPFAGAVARLLQPDGVWLAIEPNSHNPYIWLHQERMRRADLDEDHFRRKRFERELSPAGLRVIGRTPAFAVPGFVRTVPRPVARLERIVERVPVLAGSVVYRLSPA